MPSLTSTSMRLGSPISTPWSTVRRDGPPSRASQPPNGPAAEPVARILPAGDVEGQAAGAPRRGIPLRDEVAVQPLRVGDGREGRAHGDRLHTHPTERCDVTQGQDHRQQAGRDQLGGQVRVRVGARQPERFQDVARIDHGAELECVLAQAGRAGLAIGGDLDVEGLEPRGCLLDEVGAVSHRAQARRIPRCRWTDGRRTGSPRRRSRSDGDSWRQTSRPSGSRSARTRSRRAAGVVRAVSSVHRGHRPRRG